MKKSSALLLLLILTGDGSATGADNYRVGASNDLGTQYSNESKDQVRFAVVDLGTTQKPIRITNSGIILFESKPLNGLRWTAGNLETLSAGTVADINEQGTVVGNITSNQFFSATSFRLRVQPTSPPSTNLAAVWGAGQTGASVLESPKFDFDMGVSYLATFGFLGPSLDPYSCYTIDSQDASGYYGTGYKPSSKFKGSVKESRAFTIDNGNIYGEAVPDGGFQTYMACPAPDIFGAFLDGFGWGGGQLGTFHQSLSDNKKRYDVFGEKRHVSKARNGHTMGDRSYNYVRLPNGNYTNSYTYTVDAQPVPFVPQNLNSHGFVLAINNSRYAIVDSANLTSPVDTGIASFKSVFALNYREIQTVDSSGHPVLKASPQLVGFDFSFVGDSYDNRVGTLIEEDPVTGKYLSTKLTHLIASESGWQASYAYDINDAGCIVGQGWYQAFDARKQPVGDPVWKSMLLVPLQLRDEQDPATPKIIQPLPAQGANESDNAYIQRSWPDECIAYIEPHPNGGNNPEMPHLVAKGSLGIKVKWRLEVQYKRGNGYRADYIEDFTRADDTIRVPATAAGADPAFTAESDQDWRIFESPDWTSEITAHGFFGGTAKLYMWPSGQPNAPAAPVMTFRIGGKNPDQQLARNYINTQGGTQFWYAYAIAKHETYGRVRENGAIRFYNQFYTSYKGGPIGDASTDMGWAAWAKAWPLYNLDRDSKRGPQNGPGGYGMYQLTLGPKHPTVTIPLGGEDFIKRKEIWNWQDNTRGAINELQGKLADSESLLNGLQVTYPNSGAIPNYRHFSGLEAIVITNYNGMARGQIQRIPVNGYRKDPRTCWVPRASGWTFLHNRYVDTDAKTGYVYAVDKQVE